MNKKTATILLLVLCVLPFILTAVGLHFLPDRVPMHYDFTGKIDRWGSKYENYIVAGVFSVSGLLLLLVATLTEKLADTQEEREKAKSNAKVVLYVGIGMMALFCVLQASFLIKDWKAAALGVSVSMDSLWKITGVGMGILMILIGKYLPKTKQNSAVGVRTVWSMASEEAWGKSQRFGGAAFVIGGIVLCILAAILRGILILWVLLAVVLITAVACVYHSYRIGNKKER